jgi:hypothetical protein
MLSYFNIQNLLDNFLRRAFMARIPEEEIERLKREVSVQRLAEERGIDLKRHGSDLIGLCPFHEDHEPSLVIVGGNKKDTRISRGGSLAESLK